MAGKIVSMTCPINPNRPLWTPAEDAALTADQTNAELALLLNRTESGIMQRRQRLGIKRPSGRRKLPLEQRIVSHLDKTRGCWLWTGHKSKDGYGFMRYEKRAIKPHRAMWQIHNGPIPNGLYVCHRCDNPLCCNPAHLFLGTNSENQNDAVKKGRKRLGVLHHAAKLDGAKVREIRRRLAAGEPQRSIAANYGVTPAVISRIHSGHIWKQA